jgi:hypothetical protein
LTTVIRENNVFLEIHSAKSSYMDSIRRLRTDQVGSLLRPQALLDARAAWQAGRLSEAGLSQLEDEAILTALRAQEAAGQQIYVDGEFRRTGFMTGFPDSVEGFVPDAYGPIAWKGGTGSEGASPNTQLEHVPPELNRQDSHGVLDRRFYRH